MEVKDALLPSKRYRGDKLSLEATIAAKPRTEQPRTESFRYILSTDTTTELTVDVLKTMSGFRLKATPLDLVLAVGRPWPIQEPEKFYRLSETSLARFQNAGFLTDFALETERLLRNVTYLGPLRDTPKRMYQWSGDTPEDVGQMGQFAIAALLSAQQDQRTIRLKQRRDAQSFAEVIADQLKRLGVIESFSVRPIVQGRREYEVLVKTSARGTEVKLTDVGVGVSQVLPALVQAFYCPPNSTVWMEQPEIHLHPQVQAELADVFISAIHARENGKPRVVQLVIESHSEHFLNRLQRRIAEGIVKADEVAIYFASRKAGGTHLEPLQLTEDGDIENWPDNFFGDEMADLTARVEAAARRHSGAKK